MKMLYLIIPLFLYHISIYSQDTPLKQQKENNVKSLSPKEIPSSFRTVKLSMSFDTVFSELKQDNLLIIKDSEFGDFDEKNPHWIVAKLLPVMPYIYYQFDEDKLYAISVFFSKKHTSYSTLYQKLKKKYGAPKENLPHQVVWESENIKMILDNLPSIKYIYKPTLKVIAKKIGKKGTQTELIDHDHALAQKIINDL